MGYFIDPSLLKELRRKRDILLKKVPNETGLRSSLFEAAHLEASYHSTLTEPDHAVRAQRIGRKRDFRKTRGQLEEAQTYAQREFNGIVTQPFVIGLAKLLEPSINGYRTDSVRIQGYAHSGINPAKINEQMDALVDLVNDPSIDPVERAIIFQLHFLRIHPFSDGNGRTGRLVQNTLLAHNHYAPACLAPGERKFYNDSIYRAQRNFKERESDGDMRAPELMRVPPPVESPEGHFMAYMASKVNAGMDKLMGDYEDLSHYDIALKGIKDPGEVMRLKKILVNHFNFLRQPAHVKVVNLKKGRIEVQANISDSDITRILDKKTNLSYSLYRYA